MSRCQRGERITARCVVSESCRGFEAGRILGPAAERQPHCDAPGRAVRPGRCSGAPIDRHRNAGQYYRRSGLVRGPVSATLVTRRAKPAGVIGAEIWVKVDGPPWLSGYRVATLIAKRSPSEARAAVSSGRRRSIRSFWPWTRGALHARLRRPAGGQAGAVHAPLGELARRDWAVGRDGHGDDWGVKGSKLP